MTSSYCLEFLRPGIVKGQTPTVLATYAEQVRIGDLVGENYILNPFTGNLVNTKSVWALILRLFCKKIVLVDPRESVIFKAICMFLPTMYLSRSVKSVLSYRYKWRRDYFNNDNTVVNPFTETNVKKCSPTASIFDRVFDTGSWYQYKNAYGNGIKYYTFICTEDTLLGTASSNTVTLSDVFMYPTTPTTLLTNLITDDGFCGELYTDLRPLFEEDVLVFNINVPDQGRIFQNYSPNIINYIQSDEYTRRLATEQPQPVLVYGNENHDDDDDDDMENFVTLRTAGRQSIVVQDPDSDSDSDVEEVNNTQTPQPIISSPNIFHNYEYNDIRRLVRNNGASTSSTSLLYSFDIIRIMSDTPGTFEDRVREATAMFYGGPDVPNASEDIAIELSTFYSNNCESFPSDNGDCIVCMDTVLDKLVILLPCRHQQICITCMRRCGSTCTLCRTNIKLALVEM
ncbi:hypothetical protein [Trichoplusia ni ascovirus 2c]|uniref:hypothetical protein n=1 Tax=Trichoplusia ni ascovirus 2c TaxID=328615 RepID=UPI0000E44227|nr:hypothetical protein TNAV2c_gp079 [Trichoplusia ni ascovirus 2c]ABF70596.1 hypothetical protein [Trichoplusia ni ascovirus 2c]